MGSALARASRPSGAGARGGLAARGAALAGLAVLAGLHAASAAPWPPGAVLDLVLGGETRFAALIVAVRLPRLAAAALGGALLAVAGVVFQAVTTNRLAAPGVLGVTSGAQVGLAVAVLGFPALASFPALPAFLGGLAAAGLTAAIARTAGGGPAHLILAGLAVTLFAAAVANALALFNNQELAGVFVWSAGDVAQGSWHAVVGAAWVAAPAAVALAALAGPLNLLRLGPGKAASLGVNVGRVRLSAGALAVLLTAVAVSTVGPIAFLGLIVPNALRALGLHRPGQMAVPAAFLGAGLLVAADLVALHASAGDVLIPAGLVMALIGAPVLVALVVWRLDDAGGSLGAMPARKRFSARFLVPALSALAAGLAVASLSLGHGAAAHPAALFRFLTEPGAGDLPAFVLGQRLPRTAVALLAGSLLALAGVMLQGIVRNPLAGPEILGLTQGASLAALAAVLVLPWDGRWLIQAAAFGGAGLTVGVVMGAAGRQPTPARLALIGVALSGLAAAVSAVAVHAAGLGTAQVLTWLAGTTYARGWPVVLATLPAGLLAVPAALLVRRLDLLALGPVQAAAAGVGVRASRRGALLVAAGASGFAVAAVGPVAFVGLVAPHAARLLVGGRHGPLLAVAPLLGGCLLAVADLAGRTVAEPVEVPVGIVTALIGAPYFLVLLARSGRPA